MRNGNVNLPSTQSAARQTAKSVGEEALLGGDLRGAAIVELVRARNADTARAIHIDPVASISILVLAMR